MSMVAIVQAQAPSRPLPDRDTLLREVRRRMRGNDALMARYRYHEQIVDYERDERGVVTRRSVRVYKARPDRWGVPMDWILLSRDGVAVPPAEVDRLEREWQERSAREAQEHGRESAAGQSRRQAREAKEVEEESHAIDEVFQVSDSKLLGRELVDGRNAIVLSFGPKKQSDPHTFLGKVMSRAAGRAWFDETTYELVRFDAQTIDTVTYGWGLVARVHEGAKLTLERRPVNQEVWLPSSYRLVGNLRLFLLKETRIDREVQFSQFSRN